jgi:SagB-type dehydrogenase family enzyme
MTDLRPTVEFASVIYGPEGVALDDPAENYHEASRLYPDAAPVRLPGLAELSWNAELEQTVTRASRTHDQRPGIDLPETRLGGARLRDVLFARRSRAPRSAAPLPKTALAALLGAVYRSRGGRRPVPSGGALYPLEVYVVALLVEQVEPAVYHYNPYRHRLERLRPADTENVGVALVDRQLLDRAAAVIVVTAMFWRTRFKYGQRGYRFALLEAGHLVQNVVLAAAALDVDALPLGGFYDSELDALVAVDGLEESTVYAVVLGGRR